MSRYTPKHRRPDTKPKGSQKPKSKKPKPPGTFVCKVCEKAFRTEEALATHALDAHGQPLDINAMAALSPGMVRCPECGMPMRKRNLQQHLRFVHELVG
jgi:uncharacterized C2H2 Zn-finger protein